MSSEIGVKPKREKFFIIQNIIIDEWGPIIASDGVAVYCLLARKANSDTGIAWMSQEWIADRLCLSKGTVGTVLGDLEDLGLITCERRRDPQTGQVVESLYTLVETVPAPTIKPEEAPRILRSAKRQAKRSIAASLPTTNRSVKPKVNCSDKAELNGSERPELTVAEYKDSSGNNIDSSLDVPRPDADQPSRPADDDVRDFLGSLGVQGQTLDNLTLKAIMDGVRAADIAALVDAARADFAARRVEFSAAAFLALYPYKRGWTYQPPAPRKPQPIPFTPPAPPAPPPEQVTHQEVVTRRPYAVLPDTTPCPLTAAERKQKWHEAIARRRNALITTT